MSKMQQAAVLSLATLALTSSSSALVQDDPFNASLLGTFEEGSSIYGDVWADGDYAYIAHFFQSEVDIIDISDPSDPTFVTTYDIGFPNGEASSQDVKTGDGLMFVGLEFDNDDGVEIVDIRNPASPQLLTTVDVNPGTYEVVHNLFYYEGWLFLANSRDNTVAIIDLRNYDPDNPPAAITGWDYQLTSVGDIFVHDITVQHDRLYAASWDGLRVYDVSNLGTQAPQFLGSVLGINTHSVWATEDGQYMITAEEREGGALRLYEIIDNGSSLEFIPRDSHAAPEDKAFTTHNPIIRNDRIYASYYQWGAIVLEIDRSTKTLEVVASYDTSTETPDGYTGNWGAHPLVGEDAVLLSDIQNGLFVVDMSALQFTWPTGRPATALPGETKAITVEIGELGGSVLDAGTLSLFSSVDGGAYSSVPMLPVGGDQYEASLPAGTCGSRIDYYVSSDDTQARTFTSPAMAPTDSHTVYVAAGLITVFADDFEADLGWTVTNSGVSDGAWTRVDPVASGAQPGDDDPEGSGTFAYVTGQGVGGGSSSADDLDGGPTRLISPTMDFSGGDGLIRYARWFYNDTVDDNFRVQISDDGGSSWTTVSTLTDLAGGWVHETFRISDFVTPTDEIVVRFLADDNSPASVYEAGVDSFEALQFDCSTNASATVRNGTGVNPVVYANLTLPQLGTDWDSEIDTSGHPGATFTYIVGHEAPTTGPIFSVGELLVDLTSPFVLQELAPVVSDLASYSLALPSDAGFVGFQASIQGVIFGGGYVELTNALDLLLDF